MRIIAGSTTVVCLLLAGCSAMTGFVPTSPSTTVPLDTVAQSPTPVAEPTAARSPAATASASLAASTRQTASPPLTTIPSGTDDPIVASTRFWDLSTGGDSLFWFESLREITADSDLVVVGRVTAVRPADTVTLGDPETYESEIDFAYVTVEIEEVLSGVPATRTSGSVDLRIPIWQTPLDEVAADLPDDRHLLFLINGAEYSAEVGDPAAEQERWRYIYHLNGPGAVVRDIDGIARGARTENPDLFPAPVEGVAFEEVVERTRAAEDRG